MTLCKKCVTRDAQPDKDFCETCEKLAAAFRNAMEAKAAAPQAQTTAAPKRAVYTPAKRATKVDEKCCQCENKLEEGESIRCAKCIKANRDAIASLGRGRINEVRSVPSTDSGGASGGDS